MFDSSLLSFVLSEVQHMVLVSFYSNTTSVTRGVGTANHSGAPQFTSDFSGVCVIRSLVFSVMYCRSLFVLFLLASVLSVL